MSARRMTLARHILEQEQKHPEIRWELSALLAQIELVAETGCTLLIVSSTQDELLGDGGAMNMYSASVPAISVSAGVPDLVVDRIRVCLSRSDRSG